MSPLGCYILRGHPRNRAYREWVPSVAAVGVWLFTLLRAIGQLDLTIGLSYVLLLSTVGGLMVNESVRAIVREQKGKPATPRRGGAHTWIHGLPLKMRFKRSKIYVSA